MKIALLSIFPKIFEGFISSSLIEKALKKELIQITTRDIRDFAEPPHYQVDDIPYGGGAGMVMKPEPLVKAIRATKQELPNAVVVLLTPSGKQFNQRIAESLSGKDLILVAGRYEGVDQRAIDLEVDLELSIGDYILMGGEIAAMAVIEATTRLLPGVLGNENSARSESFSNLETSQLEAPKYTRPQNFEGLDVPEVLLSGNHSAINKWRQDEGIKLTQEVRPDLTKKH